MTIRKIIASIAAGAMLFGLAGSAMAAVCDPAQFIYGASAQFNFWKDQAGPFLATTCGPAGVTTKCYDSKHCVAYNAAGDYIGIASKASYDGLCAIASDPAGNLNCSANNSQIDHAIAANGTVGAACLPGFRAMADPTTAGTSLRCEKVTIGASDVEQGCFTQTSSGSQYGPLGDKSHGVPVPITRNFAGVGSVNGYGANDAHPVVVPFAFFANKNVLLRNGNPISNITTAEVNLIFSGQIELWDDMGGNSGAVTDKYAAGQNMQVCMRHAGSGTHATIAATQMKAPLIAASTELSPVPALPTAGYAYWFNDGSPDLLNCVNGVTSGTWTWGTVANQPLAIGYSDADQLVAAETDFNGNASTYPNIIRLSLNGVSADAGYGLPRWCAGNHAFNGGSCAKNSDCGAGTPPANGYCVPTTTNDVKTHVLDGTYNFWTVENFYTPAAPDAYQQAMLSFAADPGNQNDPSYATNCQMTYWRTGCGMPVFRLPIVNCPAVAPFPYN